MRNGSDGENGSDAKEILENTNLRHGRQRTYFFKFHNLSNEEIPITSFNFGISNMNHVLKENNGHIKRTSHPNAVGILIFEFCSEQKGK